MVRDVVLAHGLDADDLEPGLLDQPTVSPTGRMCMSGAM